MADAPGRPGPTGLEVRLARSEEVPRAERLAAATFSDRTPPAAPGAPQVPGRSAPGGGPDGPADGSDDAPAAGVLGHGASRCVVAVTDDGTVVGTAFLRLRGQWFLGERVPSAAVSAVAVDAAHRGRRVGSAVVATALAAAAEAGAATCSLVPSAHRVYRSSGFGVAGRRPLFQLSARELRSELPTAPGAGRTEHVLRPARPDDAAAVADLVALRGWWAHGSLDHRRADPGPAQDPSGPGTWVLERRGSVTGWCALDRRPPTVRGATFDVAVLDLVGATPDDEVVLWREAVADVPAAAVAVALVAPGGLLEHLLERQVAPVEDGTWMLALLDAPAALRLRGYPAGLSAAVSLQVDDVRGGGSRRIDLQVRGGRATTTATSSSGPGPAPDARLDAADLASVYAGHLDPVQAAAQGRLDARPEAARLLRSVFAAPAALLTAAF